MSYFPGTFPKEFCRSDDHRPSTKPEPLYNDFWDTLYYENIVVLNLLFLKILKVKVGFLEKYAYFMVKITILFSGRPQKLEAVL